MSGAGDRAPLVVAGGQGQGKTELAVRWLRAAEPDRMIAIDPSGAIAERLQIAAVGERELAAALGDARRRGEYRFAFVPTSADCRAPVGRLAAFVLETGGLLVADEAHQYAPHRKPGPPPELVQLARRGGQVGAHLWIVSQRPADVSPDLTPSARRAIFWLQNPRDLAHVADVAGNPARAIVAGLPERRFLYVWQRECWIGELANDGTVRVVERLQAADLTGRI